MCAKQQRKTVGKTHLKEPDLQCQKNADFQTVLSLKWPLFPYELLHDQESKKVGN